MSRKQSLLEDSNSKPIFDRVLEDKVGFGEYQRYLYFFIGFVMIADGSEMTALSILLPVLQTEWGVSSAQQGALGTALFIGVFLGSICSGLVADRFGRRKTLMYVSFVQFWFGILSAFVGGVFFFIIIRGLFGLMIGFTIPIAPTMASELTPTAFRGKGIAIVNFCFTIGKIYSVIMAKFTLTSLITGNWRLMLFLSSIPSLIVSFGAWKFIKESPRYLLVSGRIEEGIQTLDEIGRINNQSSYTPITQAEKQAFIHYQQETFNTQDMYSFNSLWSPSYKVITTCLWVIWYLMQFIEMGIIFILPFIINAISGETNSTGTKGLNDMIFTVLMETPSILVSLSIIEKENFGRKGSIITMMSIVLTLFVSMFIFPLSSFVFLIALVKLSQKIAYGMLYPLTTELYPTTMRIPGFSFATAFGRLGAATMPSVVLALFNVGPLMPIFGFGILAACIIYACYMIPYDTRGVDLDKKVKTNNGVELTEKLTQYN